MIGESDPEGCAACPGPQNAYRNGTMYSSYTAASFARIWELAQKRRVNLEGVLTWAFEFEDQPWFAGYRQLSTNGVNLPVLNVFRMFAKLGPERIAATSDAQIPLDQIVAEGVRGETDVGTLATRTPEGGVAVLLWNYHDDDVPGPDAAVRLTDQRPKPKDAGAADGLARRRIARQRVRGVESHGLAAVTECGPIRAAGEGIRTRSAALAAAIGSAWDGTARFVDSAARCRARRPRLKGPTWRCRRPTRPLECAPEGRT